MVCNEIRFLKLRANVGHGLRLISNARGGSNYENAPTLALIFSQSHLSAYTVGLSPPTFNHSQVFVVMSPMLKRFARRFIDVASRLKRIHKKVF